MRDLYAYKYELNKAKETINAINEKNIENEKEGKIQIGEKEFLTEKEIEQKILWNINEIKRWTGNYIIDKSLTSIKDMNKEEKKHFLTIVRNSYINILRNTKDAVLHQAKKVYARLEEEERRKKIQCLEQKVKDMNNLIVSRLVVVVTTKCTLRCKHCNNLMPLYPKAYHRDLNEVVDDIRLFFKAVDKCITLKILGGETLLYPHLSELLDEIVRIDKVAEIELTTNGTVLPNETLCKSLHQPNILVRITKYPNVKTFDALIKRLNEYGIRYKILELSSWYDPGEPINHNKTIEELKDCFAKCPSARYCKTLLNGKLYACARGASLYDLGYCNDTEGYVELSKSQNLREDIRSFYLKEYDDVCNFCQITQEKRIPIGEQM